MSDSAEKKLSKYLSLILRHKPEKIGLKLDQEGWADINELMAKSDIPFSYPMLESTVQNNDKQRFVISDDRNRIRANQGHSLSVDLGLEPVEPPAYLYHGTATRYIEAIKMGGLQPQDREYVHLSKDEATAKTVGSRHGKPVIITLEAKRLHQEGFKFYQAKNGVWLTNTLPPEELSFPT